MNNQSSAPKTSSISNLENNQADLFEAARSGDAGRIQTLIAEGVDVNGLDDEGYTALFYATRSLSMAQLMPFIENNSLNDEILALNRATSGNLEAISALIQGGANPNQTDSRGYTPLFYTILGGSLDAVTALIAAGADVNYANPRGVSALCAGLGIGRLDSVELLLKAGADINHLSTQEDTSLFAAAEGGKVEAIKLLLGKGLDINHVNKRGETALFSAAYGGKVEAIEFLLEQGLSLNHTNSEGETPLFSAALHGKMHAIQFLLDKGADVHHTNQLGRTALFAVDVHDNFAVIELLLSKGLNINNVDTLEQTPLFSAALNGRMQTIEFLLEQGLSLNHVNALGETPLFAAALSGQMHAIQFLLDKGADVNHQDHFRNTALTVSARRDNPADLVNLLISRGADVMDSSNIIILRAYEDVMEKLNNASNKMMSFEAIDRQEANILFSYMNKIDPNIQEKFKYYIDYQSYTKNLESVLFGLGNVKSTVSAKLFSNEVLVQYIASFLRAQEQPEHFISKNILEQANHNISLSNPVNIKNNLIDLGLMKESEVIEDVPGDGNCFFHAISGLTNIPQNDLRVMAINYIRDHRENLAPFIEGSENNDIEGFIENHLRSGTWADNIMIQSLANALENYSFEIRRTDGTISIIAPEQDNTTIDNLTNLRLYYTGNHYMIIRDNDRNQDLIEYAEFSDNIIDTHQPDYVGEEDIAMITGDILDH